MNVSVIIVSYNVYPFLDNCLRSVKKALEGITGEIIVVDNASVDRTPALLREHYPEVSLIENNVNVGFAKANNQAIREAHGEFILLLNPDTIVEEKTLSSCLAFMRVHPEAGAAGVRMIDGSGRFLPESKRGLPTLASSFMKMTGLYRLFPASARFNRYYQGHIGEFETAPIEVLTGAFMFLRKSALDKTGLLDEQFFMYGEDIDLSYRITKAGYSIYYLPETSIIHYKGESTRKTTLNYLLTFYEAMLIFTEKHPEFSGQQFLIRSAIYLHGTLQFLRQTASRLWLILLDTVMLLFSWLSVSYMWASYHFGDPHYFRKSFYTFNLPLYTLLALSAMYLNGAYDKPLEGKRSYPGFLYGAIFILVVYAFLPTHLRTSRMVIAGGSILFFLLLAVSRNTLRAFRQSSQQTEKKQRRAIIVGSHEEAERIRELINRSKDQIEILGTVRMEAQKEAESDLLGTADQLDEIVRIHMISEIIFSAQDVPFSFFTKTMSKLGPGLRYMLAASSTLNIVGSISKDSEGESYGLQIHFRLSQPVARRTKRFVDIVVSLLLLAVSPLLILVIRGKINLIRNMLKVLFGKMTWVSYHPMDPVRHALPALRNGVLAPAYVDSSETSTRRLEHIDYVYARDFHWSTDVSILISQWKRLGQNLHA